MSEEEKKDQRGFISSFADRFKSAASTVAQAVSACFFQLFLDYVGDSPRTKASLIGFVTFFMLIAW